MEEDLCFKIVQRWSYYNSAMLGLVVGYILGRIPGALIGIVFSIAVNYGLMASAKIVFKGAKEGYKLVEKELSKKN